jgi:hypothetical protein
MQLRLTQYRNFLAVYEFKINFISEPRFAWCMGEAIGINLNLFDQAMPSGFVGQ